MSERRRGLGRGLGALIPAASGPEVRPAIHGASGPSGTVAGTGGERGSAAAKAAGAVGTLERPLDPEAPGVSRETVTGGADTELREVDGAYFAEIPLDAIKQNPRQPRDVFDEEALKELVHSIKEVGLLQPVVVRQVGPERYELIMGERRWRACREAGLDAIPAIVRATEDEKLLLDALLENLHRSQLNALEEAAAYDQLLRDFSCTHDELADRIGRSRAQVTNTLRLLKLPPSVQRRVAAKSISAGHARALLGLDSPQEQEQLADRINAEGLSVRTVEEIVMLARAEQPKPKPRRPRAGKVPSPALASLASRLSDRFDTRVKVDLGAHRGKIVVEFATVEDLKRILDSFAPGEGQRLKEGLGGASGDAEV
ncbi:ParB/RepB/Spo0J family partition protein [Streptacidiphilus sp. PB12-B1b]|uniref:ParB/RepB/Spo0J family partition protein n=1 Tax=Streptacidiphilus sp. PB12-B1b TaxID=2705012 RepID=UPI0015FBF6CB|nr:ParB/RepB/Spo0J family partition protein [Streptacidiphilus sp. PB12-B1b]QMU79894.1 ParB/RepB/Spo0J family partition protein [Streptacidiphilus sp. PB12-B1b]